MRKLTHAQIVRRQSLHRAPRRLPMSVVLDDVRSLHNVGSIFRTADGLGVAKIWLCGITGFPPRAAIAKTALGAEMAVPWEHRRDVVATVRRLKEAGWSIVVLEQTDASVAYSAFSPHPPVCLVLGGEIEGVCSEVVELADAAVEIEMAGIKNSLNVAVAFGVVAYHFRRALLEEPRKSPVGLRPA